MSNPILHYSGERSRRFWSRIKRIRNDAWSDALYALGCVLQNLETAVLSRLRQAETEQRVAIRGRKDSKP